jgi:hypothetical protein
MYGWQNQFLLFGFGREDLVEVDGDAERDQEETTNTGYFPIRRLEGWRGRKLVPE